MAVGSVDTAREHLVRRLGVWSAVGFVIGITIGSGIFRTPSAVAARVPDPGLMLLVWLLGGLISLCGALSVAELAASFPQTGGWYVYLREGWGGLCAFLFGWAELFLIRASAVGALATVFAEYFLRSIGYVAERPDSTADYVAAAAIVVVGWTNIRGVRLAAGITGVSTIAKATALVLLVLLAFIVGHRSGGSFEHFTSGAAGAVTPGLFGLALISALFAYDGFADVSYIAGEVVSPQRNLPRAILIGTLAIIAIYVSANAAYLYVFPIDALPRSPLIAADTMGALTGDAGVAFVSVIVAVSTFGALNAVMLGPPRVFFAMAEDGLFFRAVARVHPKYGTPYVAILLAAGLGVAFVLTRTFEELADTFVLAIWPFYGIAVAGLYRLRRTRPGLARPYKVPGYPVVPAIFIAGVAYLVANALVVTPRLAGLTFAIVLAGIPAYYWIFRRRVRAA